MSYILDALKKADRERNIGEVPDLETAHWGARKPGRSQLWVWGLGALLVFNGLLLFVMLDRDETEEIVTTVQSRHQTAPPESRPARPVQSVPVTPELSVTTRPRVEVLPPVTRPPAVQPVVRPAQPEQFSQAVPASRPAPVAQGEFEFPEWRELSLEFRSGFTLPHIDVHVYAEDPRRRFIMVDLKKYREGETLTNGALLEKIYPGSIQLKFQGKRFRVER